MDLPQITPTRRNYLLLGLALLVSAGVLWGLTQVNVRALSPHTLARFESEQTEDGRQYRVMVALLRPPLEVRRLWELRLGDALEHVGVWAYHDGYAMYVRVGLRLILRRLPECYMEIEGRGVVELPCE